MSTRRNFFKYLGLAGGVATGGVVAAASLLPNSGKCEAVEKIQNNTNGATLQLDQTYRKNEDLVFTTNEQEKIRFGNDGFYANMYDNPYMYHPSQQPGTKVSVKMTPGPDGEMYLNINGKWRKIVTE